MNPSTSKSRLPSGGRRIVILLSAVVTLLAIDLSVRHLQTQLDRYEVGEYRRRPEALITAPMPDIVLMGSSRAKYGLVPEVFEATTGRQAYNCAISGSKIVEWLGLARHMFAAHQPRLVVLGINASEVRADYCPSEAALNLFDWPDLIESCRIDGVQFDVIGSYFRKTLGPSWALFGQRYALKMWGQEHLASILPKNAQQSRELRERAARPTPADGYYHPWAYGRQLQNLELKLLRNVADVESARPPEFSPDSPTFVRLEQLLDFLAERRISTLVAYLPNSPRTEARWATAEPQIIERIAAICRGCGAEFLPCDTADVRRSNADYMEEIHMGYPLAQRISLRISQRINELGLLPGTQLAQQAPMD